jgi:hypothetical protein
MEHGVRTMLAKDRRDGDAIADVYSGKRHMARQRLAMPL